MHISVFFNVNADDQFNFDVTEIQISENGNKIIGSKSGTVKTDDGIIIDANEFEYNKISNTLIAKGSVKFIDQKNDYKIFADTIIYLKNEEKITTEGNSKAIYNNGLTINSNNFNFNKKQNTLNATKSVKIKNLEKDYEIYTEEITYYKNLEKMVTVGNTEAKIHSNYNFFSSDINYFLNKEILSSNNPSTIKDKNSNIYKLTKFNYQIEKEILKGEDFLIITNNKLPKSDRFYFKDGMADLKNGTFFGKDIKINIHKDVFGRNKNDPRLVGVSATANNEVTTINKGTFTSCKINDDCPPWSISANKIKHNKKKKQLSYENAYLKIYDFPIFYFPKFFHPDPSVNRQSGFLKPEINNSNILGSSISVPYYKEISDSRDITFTPTVFDKDIFMLENEYRKSDSKYNILIDYGFVKNYESPTTKKRKNLSHFLLKFNKDLDLDNFEESSMNLSLEKSTNDTYFKVFDQYITKSSVRPNDLNKLNNHLKLKLNNNDFNFESGIEIYEDLQTNNNSDKHQFILPYYYFNKEIIQNRFDGILNFYSSGNNTLKDTNNFKSLIINDIDYNSINFLSKLGISTNYNLNIKNLNSIGKKTPNYKSSPQVELLGLLNIDSSLPLIKTNENYTNFLTPKISFRLNPSDMKNYSTSSNKVNVGNIFSKNRLGLTDTFEAGKSITLGLDFKRERKNDLEKINKYFEIKLATVLRDKEENFIPKESTLNRKNSNLFGTIKNEFSKNLSFNYDFALDNNYKSFEYNNLNALLSFNNFSTKISFIEENGEMGDSNVFENEISYKFDDQNYLSFNSRRNRKLNLTEYYNLVYEYKNDCLTAGIKYKKSYYEDRDLKPTENLLFTISLFPITTYEHDAQDFLN